MSSDTDTGSRVETVLRAGFLLAVVLGPVVFATGFTMYESLKFLHWGVVGTTILVCLTVHALCGGVKPRVDPRAFGFGALFFAFAGIAVLWSPVREYALAELAKWLCLWVLFLIAAWAPWFSREDLSVAASVGAFGSGVVGLLELGGVVWFRRIWDAPGATGAFDSLEVLLPFYVVSLPLAMAVALGSKGWRGVAGWCGFVAGGLHFGLAGDPSAALVGCGVMVFVTLVFRAFLTEGQRSLTLRPLALIALLSLPPLGALQWADTVPAVTDATDLQQVLPLKKSNVLQADGVRGLDFATGRWESLPTAATRHYLRAVFLKLFTEKPIVGQGTGGWLLSQTRDMPDHPFTRASRYTYPRFRSAHGSQWTILVEFGLVGFLLFLIWLGTIETAAVGQWRALQEREGDRSRDVILFWAFVVAALLGVLWSTWTASIEFVGTSALLFVVFGVFARDESLQGESFLSRRSSLVTFLLIGVFVQVAVVSLAIASYERSWGDLMMLRGRSADAAEVYSNSRVARHLDAEVAYNHCLALQRGGGDSALCGDLVETAKRLAPNDARMHHLAGVVAIKEQDMSSARKESRRARHLFPNYISAAKTLALSYDLENNFEQAAKVLEEELARNPPKFIRIVLHVSLGGYYQDHLSRLPRAVEHYKKAVELYEPGQRRDILNERIESLEQAVARTRLEREGKPIPPSLMPGKTGDPHGHGGRGAGPGNLPPPRGMTLPPNPARKVPTQEP
jgi:hypothetical protein